MENNGEI